MNFHLARFNYSITSSNKFVTSIVPLSLGEFSLRKNKVLLNVVQSKINNKMYFLNTLVFAVSLLTVQERWWFLVCRYEILGFITIVLTFCLLWKTSWIVISFFYVIRCFQTELARDVGYSASRYGHVMFPENVYEPALRSAELLLDGVGKGLYSFCMLFFYLYFNFEQCSK